MSQFYRLVLVWILFSACSEDSAFENPPRWTECRSAYLDNSFTAELKERCEFHRSASDQKVYGIRWIYLTDISDEWHNVPFKEANALFAPAGLQFKTTSVLRLSNTIVEKAYDLDERRLGDYRSELEQVFDVQNAPEDQLLQVLKDRLSQVGADRDEIEALSMDSIYNHPRFLKLLARVFSDEIVVVVAGEVWGETRGISSGPGHNPTSLQRSIVAIRPTKDIFVLSHELGHYFGLIHTHGAGSGLFSLDSVLDYYELKESHDLFEALQKRMGPEFTLDPGEPLLEYDASPEETLDYSALRYAMNDLWSRKSLVYYGNFQRFDSFSSFATAALAGDELFMMNYIILGEGKTNCVWNTSKILWSCAFPHLEQSLDSNELFFKGSLFAEDGVTPNAMSYMEKNENDRGIRFLNKEQLRIVRINSNSEERRALKNLIYEE